MKIRKYGGCRRFETRGREHHGTPAQHRQNIVGGAGPDAGCVNGVAPVKLSNRGIREPLTFKQSREHLLTTIAVK
jgi:hypothetical protein